MGRSNVIKVRREEGGSKVPEIEKGKDHISTVPY